MVGSPGQPHRGPFKDAEKDGPSYYPYPTIAWDYINRAMPASKPGSLTPDEVYAVVAFLLLSERHHPGERRPRRQELCRRSKCRTGMASFRQCRCIPRNQETQLVLSESGPLGKWAVGILLSVFGIFWIGKGLGLRWQGEDLAVLALAGAFLVVLLAAVGFLRARPGGERP